MLSTPLRLRHAVSLVAVTPLLLAACGGERTDISAAVDDTNKNLAGAAKLDCADEIDGGEGTKFDCTLKGKGGSQKVEIKIIEDGIAPVSEKAYVSAVQKASGQ